MSKKLCILFLIRIMAYHLPHLKKVDTIYIQQQGHLIDKHTKVLNVEATFSKDFINSSPCPPIAFQDVALLL
jgi:hypothetical protein